MRPRRIPSRLLALALAVGLSGLLVGLSVAPRVLPGDTIRIMPRAAEGPADQHSVAAGLRPGLANPLVSATGWLLAVVPTLLLPAVALLLLARGRSGRTRRLGPAIASAGCRGPPRTS